MSTWFTEKRISWIKQRIERYGFINRQHLIDMFEISMPQASHDIQEAIKRWPNLMTYNGNTKRYEGKKKQKNRR